MTHEPTRREVANAFERSVELLERVGGRHNITAAFLRRQLAGMAAARLAQRDAAIVALRRRWLPHESTLAAARTIARDLQRYAASAWKRRDRAFVEPPASYAGTPYELAFRIVALSGAKLPGAAAVRKILENAGAAKIVALSNNSGLALDFSRVPRSAPMFADPNFIETVKAVPEFRAAAARAVEAEVVERRAHVEALAKLDAAAEKAYASEEKRKAAAIAKLRAAERDVKTATAEALAVEAAIAGERQAREAARRAHESALLAADFPEIDAFLAEADEDIERTRRAVVVVERNNRNPITRRVERTLDGNGESVKARLAAILASIRAAPALRLLADRREIPARLAELRASWPTVTEPADASRTSGSKAD